MTKEYTKPLQESVIDHEKYKEYEAARDVLTRLKVATVDIKKSRDSLLNHLGKGLDSYRVDLYQQACLLVADHDLSKILAKEGVDSFNLHKLSTSKVEDLRKNKKITTAQALLLHQICSINSIYAGLYEIKTKGAYSQKSLLDILIILNDINTHSRFIVQIAQTDEESYRLFQVLNHFAYSGFTAELWQNYIGESSVNNTLQNFAKAILNALKLNNNGESSNTDFTKSSLDLALDGSRNGIVDFFANHDKDLQRRIEQLSREVLPSFLGVRHSGSESQRLYILLSELIDLEDNFSGFKVSSEFFHGYLTACVNDNEKVKEIKFNISEHIDLVRQAKEQRKKLLINGDSSELDLLTEEKSRRSKLLVVFNNTKKLLNEEIDKIAKLTLVEQQELKEVVAKLPAPAVFKIAELLNKHVLPAELHAQVNAIVRKSNVPKLSKELISKGVKELFAVKNDRITYYHSLLQSLKNKLEVVDRKVIQRIDIENYRAQALLAVNEKITSIITSNQHNGVLGGVIYNPTEFALTKCMPYRLSARLAEIEKIRQELPVLRAIYKDGKQFREGAWHDGRPVSNAYARLEQSIRALELKQEQYQINNLLLTLESTVLSADKQLKEFTLKHNKDFAISYSIDIGTMKKLNKKDFKVAEEIKQEVHKVKVKLFEQNRSRLALVWTSDLLHYITESVDLDGAILTKKLSELKDIIDLYKDVPELAVRTSKLQKLSAVIEVELQSDPVNRQKLNSCISVLELELKKNSALEALDNINDNIEALKNLISKNEKNSNFRFDEVKLDLARFANYYSGDDVRRKLAVSEKPVGVQSYPGNQGWVNYILNKTVLGIKLYNRAVKVFNILKSVAKFLVLIVTYPFAQAYKFLNRKLRKNHRQFIDTVKSKISKIEIFKKNKGLTDSDRKKLNTLIKKLKVLDDKIGRFSTNFYDLVFEDYEKIKQGFKEEKNKYSERMSHLKVGLEQTAEQIDSHTTAGVSPDMEVKTESLADDDIATSSVSTVDEKLEDYIEELISDLDLSKADLDDGVQQNLQRSCHLFIVNDIYDKLQSDSEVQKVRLQGLIASDDEVVTDIQKQALIALNESIDSYKTTLTSLKAKLEANDGCLCTEQELLSLETIQKKLACLKHDIDTILVPPKPEDILKTKAVAEADKLFASTIADGPLRRAAIKALAAATGKSGEAGASEFAVSIEFLKAFANSVIVDQGGAVPAIAQAIEATRKHFADTAEQGVLVCYSKMVDYLLEIAPKKYSDAQDLAMSYLTLESTDDDIKLIEELFERLKKDEEDLKKELEELKGADNNPVKAAKIYEIYEKLTKLDKNVDAAIYPPSIKDKHEQIVAYTKEKLALKFLSSDILTNAVKSATSAAMTAALDRRPGDMPAEFLKAVLTEFTISFTDGNGEFFANILSSSKDSSVR